jgi:hypothetical protein
MGFGRWVECDFLVVNVRIGKLKSAISSMSGSQPHSFKEKQDRVDEQNKEDL